MNHRSASYVLPTRLAAVALVAITGLGSGQTSEKGAKEKDIKVVSVLRDEDCGSEAIARVKEVAGRLGVDITVEEIIVANEEQAKALNWLGSPTVRIKGLDIDPKARGKTSHAMT